jgi:hypothetical protein
MEWDDTLIAAHSAASDGWGAMAHEAAAREYATPLLCAMPDAGLAAFHAIDGDLQCVGNAAHAAACFATGTSATDSPDYQTALANEMRAQIQIIRCIFGNPFRAVAVNSSWLTPTVLSLAHHAYESQKLPEGTLDCGRLVALADTLEAAGCKNPEILAHLRSPGPHVRGCWVVDLLLRKRCSVGAPLPSF